MRNKKARRGTTPGEQSKKHKNTEQAPFLQRHYIIHARATQAQNDNRPAALTVERFSTPRWGRLQNLKILQVGFKTEFAK